MFFVRNFRELTVTILSCLFIINCGPSARYQRNGILKSSFSAQSEFVVIASYYGQKFHGKKTANGEIYNMYGLSAAHKTLPFGTILEVTNRNSKKSVRVRINDRGPFVRGRGLDLSYQAAKNIDLIRDGTGEVYVRIIRLGTE